MLALTWTRRLAVVAERERLGERFQQALGDQLRTGGQRESVGDDDELVAAQAAEGVGLADHALEPFGHRAEQFVAGAVPERVVDRLEVVEVDEQRRHRLLLWRARVSVCSIRSRIRVRFGSPVRASWVARKTSSFSRLVSSSWARWRSSSKDWHIRTRVTSRLRWTIARAVASVSSVEPEVGGALVEHLEGGVAPAQAAFRHLVQRRLALRGELGEDPPGLLPDLAGDRFALAGHPAGDGDGGDGADVLEAVFDDLVQCLRRFAPSCASSARPPRRCGRSARGPAARSSVAPMMAAHRPAAHEVFSETPLARISIRANVHDARFD